MNKIENLGLVGVAIGVLSVGYTYFVHSKINKMSDAINASIDVISKDLKIDISDAVIDQAINKAVDREVEKAVRKASNEVVATIRKDLQKEVKTSVNESYSNIRRSVSDEVAKQVANIDLRPLREDVKEKAKQMVVEKFNENLDSLLEDFNNNLTNVSKIYGSIADSMAVKKSQETILKIGG